MSTSTPGAGVQCHMPATPLRLSWEWESSSLLAYVPAIQSFRLLLPGNIHFLQGLDEDSFSHSFVVLSMADAFLHSLQVVFPSLPSWLLRCDWHLMTVLGLRYTVYMLWQSHHIFSHFGHPLSLPVTISFIPFPRRSCFLSVYHSMPISHDGTAWIPAVYRILIPSYRLLPGPKAHYMM